MAERVLVTGASGYLGSHVVKELVNAGYNVRATARRAKVSVLQEAYAQYNSKHAGKAEVVTVDDLAYGVFPEVFEGIDAVIHVASPLSGREAPDSMFVSAVEGSLNILRQAEKAGIKNMVVTSSIAAILTTLVNPTGSTTDKDWNTTTKEEALKTGDALTIYSATKTFAEKAVWEFADAHPHVEITTVNPPFLYGPFAETQKFPKFEASALSTAGFIYRIMTPGGVFPICSDHADVRDVARAHVLALRSPPTSVVGRKRIPFASPHGLDWGKVRTFIAEKRPALKVRLTKKPEPNFARDRAPVDLKRIEQVLGMKKSDFHRVEDTILETVDQLVAFEAGWKAAKEGSRL